MSFIFGLIMIYLVLPDKVPTKPFGILIVCYFIGALITWYEKPKNNLIKGLIFILLISYISLFVFPELGLEDDFSKFMILSIIIIYYINSFFAEIICNCIILFYRKYVEIYMPESIKSGVYTIMDFVPCLNPLGVLIYLGVSLTSLNNVEKVKQNERIEEIYMDVENGISLIWNYLINIYERIKPYIPDLLPDSIDNLLSQFRENIYSLFHNVPIQGNNPIIFVILSFFLILISIYFQLQIEKRINWFFSKFSVNKRKYFKIIYNLIIITLIILLVIQNIDMQTDNRLLRPYIIMSVLLIIAVMFVDSMYRNILSKNIINFSYNTSLIGLFRTNNVEYSINIKPKNLFGADIVLAIDCSESMYALDPGKSIREKAIKDLINLIWHLNFRGIFSKFCFYKLLNNAKPKLRLAFIFWNDDENTSICCLSNKYNDIISTLKSIAFDIIPATDFDNILKKAVFMLDSNPTDDKGVARSIVIITDGQRDCGGPNGYNLMDDRLIKAQEKGYQIYLIGIRVPLGSKNILLKKFSDNNCIFIEDPETLSSKLIDLIKMISYRSLANNAILKLTIPQYLGRLTEIETFGFQNNVILESKSNFKTILICNIGEIRSGKNLKLKFNANLTNGGLSSLIKGIDAELIYEEL